MKIINAVKKLIYDLYKSIRRFPLSIGLAAVPTILFIFLNHNDQYLSENAREIITRIALVLLFGVPLSLCIKLFFERKQNIKAAFMIASYLALAAVLILYYLFLLKEFKMVPITRYTAFSLASYLAFFFIPYLFKRDGFEVYVIKVISRFFTTAIYSVILFLGISAIMFTIDKLLGVKVESKIYFDVWLAVIGLFSPSFFLGGIPSYEEQFDTSSYPKLLKILLLYIVMPLIAAYTLILYIYFVKVIVTFTWPSGMVGHLVLWYSVISALVIFLISPYSSEKGWAKTFSFWLPKVILPLLILMFISVGIRVNAYGMTENRYYVIILGLWVLGVMVYLNLARIKRNAFLPLTLSLITALSVIGPWSSYSVSRMSQNTRFENILSKYNMIQDNKIIAAKSEVSDDDKREINGIIRYFSNSHTLNELRLLPKDFKTEDMQKVFGFSYSYYDNYYQDVRYFSYFSNAAKKPLDISGYDHMLMTRGHGSFAVNIDDRHEVNYDVNSSEIKILYEGKEIFKSSLQNFGKQMFDKFGETEKYELEYEDASTVEENENVKVKFVLQNLNGNKNTVTGEVKIDYVEAYILIKIK